MGAPPYRIWEIFDRAENGTFMEEDDFIKKRLIPGIRNAVKKHEIRYDPKQPVNMSDGMSSTICSGVQLCI